jgi:hypothetical protein
MLKQNSCIPDCKKLIYSIYFNFNNLEFFLATFTRFVNDIVVDPVAHVMQDSQQLKYSTYPILQSMLQSTKHVKLRLALRLERLSCHTQTPTGDLCEQILFVIL